MRIAVTTAMDAYGRWTRPMAGAGFTPVPLPCISIEPARSSTLERCRAWAASADVLVVTSARTVATLWPDGGLPDVPVLAVGEVTARAVENGGGSVALTGRGGADHLIGRAGHLVAGRKVFYPHAAGADPVPALRLASLGAELTTELVYHTVPRSPALDPVDGAVFASPSAVAGWRLSRSIRELAVVGVIGDTTKEALTPRRGIVVGSRPSAESLVAAMSRAMERAG